MMDSLNMQFEEFYQRLDFIADNHLFFPQISFKKKIVHQVGWKA